MGILSRLFGSSPENEEGKTDMKTDGKVEMSAFAASLDARMDADLAVQAFLNGFLIPVAADGKLDAIEETPLLVAYTALGVAKYGQGDDVAAYFKRHMTTRGKDIAAKITCEGQRKAHAELFQQSGSISPAGATAVIGWMQKGWQVFPVGKEESVLKEMAKAGNWGGKEDAIINAVLTIIGTRSGDLRSGPFVGGEMAYGFLVLARKLMPEPEPVQAAVQPRAVAEPEVMPKRPDGTPEKPVIAPQDFKCVEYVCTADDLALYTDPKAVWKRIQARAEEIAEWMEIRMAGKGAWNFAFGAKCEVPEVVVVRKQEDIPSNLWFVGDIHGDLLALEAALGYIDRVTSAEKLAFPTIVFLGDLFDRMQYGYETVLRILALAKDRPGHILWLAGNHDVAFKYSEKTGSFVAEVSPAELADWLNERAKTDAFAERIGKCAVKLGALLPRAIFLPDGLLAAHGGVPHTDLHGGIKSVVELNDGKSLQDFVWTRLHPRARQRVPNRNSKSCDVGILDFEAFCACATVALAQPVSRMVRGHDHIVDKRFEFYSNYKKNQVLTINTLSRREEGEWSENFVTTPCVARYWPNCLPEVHRLSLPEELVK